MFQRRRLLKKDQIRAKIKLVFSILIVLLFLAIGLEFIYFSYAKVSVISPLAKIKTSNLSNLEKILTQNKVFFSSVNANSDGSFTVNLLSGGEVILSSKKDIGSQLSSLQLMLSRLTIEGKKLKILDFRFDNPVVSF
jgi:hypothetical protein